MYFKNYLIRLVHCMNVSLTFLDHVFGMTLHILNASCAYHFIKMFTNTGTSHDLIAMSSFCRLFPCMRILLIGCVVLEVCMFFRQTICIS